MRLIAGLGNPGRRYADTRHNLGWRVAEELARRWGAETWRRKLGAFVAEARTADTRVALLRPRRYMNRSGSSVRKAMDFWKLGAQGLLVIVDDLDLDLGRLRLRPGGSAGGHNGLASIVEHLGHEEFPRLRLGIGPAPEPEEQVSFVLSPFAAEERPEVERMVGRAADAAECWVAHGVDEAMNRYNRATESTE